MSKKLVVFLLSLSFGLTLIAKEKPNVVVFLVDDLRTELGCYGSETVKSPNIDALAKDGVRFSNAYAQEAICAPSRMSILSGLRPESIGIYSIFTPLRKKHPEMVTMPQFFKENGYTTVSVGKVYHHGRDDQESWSIHHLKEPNSYVSPENIEIQKNNKKGVPFECIDVADNAYKDGRTADLAIETLNKIKDEQFLMFVGLGKPHLPFNAPKKYWDMYDKDDFTVKKKVAPKDMYRLSLTVWGELRGYYGIPKEGYLDDDMSKDLMHGYHACVSYIDAQMGKVMQTLEDLELRENTIVILMSDHGWKLGEYGAWCKHTNFELDVNVPMIVSRETGSKKRVTNATSDALVENVDLFPTLADACGFETHPLEGQSILPLVDAPDMDWKKGSYSLYPRGKKIMGFTCTDGEYRYTEWWSNETSEVLAAELYTCEQDYMEQAVNMVKDPKQADNVARMEKLLDMQFPKDRRSSYPQLDK